MRIDILRLHIENFKGVKSCDVTFSDDTKVMGANATGKTTIFDAVTWLLFGKDSHDAEKFDLRPLDDTGKLIDFVEICVVGTFRIDGAEVELKKVQKQNWVKKHGTDKPKFEGNVNECYIDGYPRSDKDFKAYIAGIISADVFKMITNPLYFPTMKWKDQRSLLMSLAGDITDAELAERLGGYEELLPELKRAPSLEDIGKKYGKTVKQLNADLEEIPVRIDELSRQMADYDVAELELYKAELLRRKVAFSGEKLAILRDRYMKLEMEVNSYVVGANAEIRERRAKSQVEISELKSRLLKLESNLQITSAQIEALTDEKARKSESSKSLGIQYKELGAKSFPEEDWVYDENSEICVTCGQKLPPDKVEEIHSDFLARKERAASGFEAEKKRQMDELLRKGYALKEEITAISEKLEYMKESIMSLKDSIESVKLELAKAENRMSLIPEEVDLSQDATYASFMKEKADLSLKIEDLEKARNDLQGVEESLADVNRKLIEAYNNEAIQNRIDDLWQEQQGKAQLIADAEKMLYLLENFTKEKLKTIAESINQRFSVVKFKLFDVQINGGVSECCECTVGGVPYSDLNSGHKIVAGLDIIRTLSEIYKATAFIFIDNAESVNEFNLPAMDCQLIRLIVTEDDALKIV